MAAKAWFLFGISFLISTEVSDPGEGGLLSSSPRHFSNFQIWRFQGEKGSREGSEASSPPAVLFHLAWVVAKLRVCFNPLLPLQEETWWPFSWQQQVIWPQLTMAKEIKMDEYKKSNKKP